MMGLTSLLGTLSPTGKISVSRDAVFVGCWPGSDARRRADAEIPSAAGEMRSAHARSLDFSGGSDPHQIHAGSVLEKDAGG